MKFLTKFKLDVQQGFNQYNKIAEKYKPDWLKVIEKKYNSFINILASINLVNLVFFGFVRSFSLVLFIVFLLYFCWYHFMLSYYLLPHWKELIVKNSPINFTATLVAMLKLSKSQLILGCVACGSIVYGADLAHERLWPEKKPPLQILGEKITKHTGYPPTDWSK